MYSLQHDLNKCLVDILESLLQIYSEYCIPKSFQFVSDIRQLQRTAYTEFYASFNIFSLFTNVHLDETIDIVLNILLP